MALGKLINCLDCNTETRSHTRGRCRKCDHKWKYANDPAYVDACKARAKKNGTKHRRDTCVECKRPDVEIKGRDRCSACYASTRRAAGYEPPRPIARCTRCEKDRPIYGGGGGMCKPCYNTSKRYVVEYRIRKRGVPGSHTEQEWLALIEECHGLCAYCLRPFTEELPATRDHIIPISRGAESSNDISNILPACVPCNSRKGAGEAIEAVDGKYPFIKQTVEFAEDDMYGGVYVATFPDSKGSAARFRAARIKHIQWYMEGQLQGIKDA